MALNVTFHIAHFARHLSPGTVSPILYMKRSIFTFKGMYFTLCEYFLFTFYPDRLRLHNSHTCDLILRINGYLSCATQPII